MTSHRFRQCTIDSVGGFYNAPYDLLPWKPARRCLNALIKVASIIMPLLPCGDLRARSCRAPTRRRVLLTQQLPPSPTASPRPPSLSLFHFTTIYTLKFTLFLGQGSLTQLYGSLATQLTCKGLIPTWTGLDFSTVLDPTGPPGPSGPGPGTIYKISWVTRVGSVPRAFPLIFSFWFTELGS